MAVQNSLAARQAKTGLTAYLTQDAVKKQINSVVGGKNGTRFISSIVSAVQTTPALQECTNPSILSAALLGEALNLSPSPQLGQFYMVPFDNKKKGIKEAQFQLGYKGYIQLAERSGYYKKLNVLAIKEGELIKYDPLNEEIPCTGRKKRCWLTRRSIRRRLSGMAAQSPWSFWNRGKFRKKKCGSIPHSGSRTSTEWP